MRVEESDGRLAPGVLVGDRYLVEGMLGIGGLAEVYRVRHTELGTLHALKLLTWQRQGLADRLLLEGRIQAQLVHPNIVRVTDVLRHQGMVALLLELVEGMSLEEMLAEREQLSLDQAMSLFGAILAAVSHAHDAKVLHRDVKPGNVLLERTPSGWVPKVTDFGLAKLVDEMGSGTRTGMSMGTPGYMAPEQVRDSASVDRRTDIFALGVLLYEMLAGARAFEPLESSSGHVEVTATVERRPEPLSTHRSDVPESIALAIDRAMALEREDRFPDCRLFAAALGISGHPALASSPGITAVPLALETAASLPPQEPSAPTFDPGPSSLGPRGGLSGRIVVLVLLGAVALAAAVTGMLVQPILDDREAVDRETDEVGVDELEVPVTAAADGLAAEGAGDEDPVTGGEAAAADNVSDPVPGSVDPAPESAGPPAAADDQGDQREQGDGFAEPFADVAPAAALPDPAPEPAGTADGEPETPAPEPPEPAPAPAPAPVPDPEPMAESMLAVGPWEGTANGRTFVLEVDSVDGSRVLGRAVLPAGAGNDRTMELSGTFDAQTGRIVLETRGGAVTYRGRLSGDRITGSYTGGRRSLEWTVSAP